MLCVTFLFICKSVVYAIPSLILLEPVPNSVFPIQPQNTATQIQVRYFLEHQESYSAGTSFIVCISISRNNNKILFLSETCVDPSNDLLTVQNLQAGDYVINMRVKDSSDHLFDETTTAIKGTS